MQEYIGKIFGKWIVVAYEGKFNRVHKFKVKCDCGNESISDYIALTRGKSTKCRSCARKISCSGNKNPAHTHGYSSLSHPYFHVYTAWCSMKSRCYLKANKNYHSYGGRGVSVCEKWLHSFEDFLADMGVPESGNSLDRIDVNGNYCPENCRWAPPETQHNNCRKTVYHEFDGEKLSETQWARKLDISRNKIMWWARKNGIEWVIQNQEALKKARVGMSDKDYEDLGLPIPGKKYR